MPGSHIEGERIDASIGTHPPVQYDEAYRRLFCRLSELAARAYRERAAFLLTVSDEERRTFEAELPWLIGGTAEYLKRAFALRRSPRLHVSLHPPQADAIEIRVTS